MEGCHIGGGDFAPVAVLAFRAADDLVVHIRKIADKEHFQPQVTELAHQDVEDDGRTGMADMAVVVGGDAADGDVRLAGAHGNEFLLAPAKGVVQLHDSPSGRAGGL